MLKLTPMRNKLLNIIMRAFIFLFCSLIFAFGPENGFSQDAMINVSSKRTLNAKQLFKLINKQTNYKFIYRTDLLKNSTEIELSEGDIKADILLTNFLNPLNLTYEFTENNTVVVKKISKTKVISKPKKNEEEDILQRIITGNISDSDGLALPGATVVEVGTENGTSTDFDGNFSITLENDEASLEVSFVGFTSQIVNVSNQDEINVNLVAEDSALDEIIITGYGTTTKRDNVSSIAQVKGDDLANQPASSVNNLLQGRAAGLQVTSPNGSPEATPTIRIRGLSSIQGNNNPLFVIDGFIAGTDFNLQNINVNDIRSIEVLKDASALALYGTRGASGVILIQTKNGKNIQKGENNLTINHYTSFSKIANSPEYMNSTDFANYWNEAETLVFGASGYGENDPSVDPLYPNVASLPNTNWVDLVTRDGMINNTDLTLSGNAEKSNYYISFNRWSEEGIIKNSGMDRYSLRANFDVNINDNLRAGLRFNLADRKTENNKVNWNNIQLLSPPARRVYNDDGTYDGLNPVSNTPERNSLADVNERVNHTYATNVLTNAYLEYQLTPELSIRSTLGLGLDFVKQNEYLPTILPERILQGLLGDADVRTRNSRDVLNENTINFVKEFGDHSLKVLAGYTLQKTTYEQSIAGAYGFVNDVVTFNNLALGSDPTVNSVSTSYSQRTFESILGRINYSYKGKYLLTLVARRDGSSVFEEGNKYAFFPSLGAAWRIGDEDFMQGMDYISNLKLRASYGIVGEQGVPAYNSLSRYTPYVTFLNDQVNNAVLIEEIASSGLDWETTYQTDIGLEIGFLNDRYSLEIDYYKKRTENLLLNKPIPGTAGTTRLANVGEIENSGLEVSINSVNIEKPDFSWSTDLTISTNKNEVISLGGEDFINLSSPGNATGDDVRIIPGYPIPAFLGAEYLGTYKTSAEIDADGIIGSVIGGPRYVDKNGDGAINTLDFDVIGDPNPDFFAGLRNTISYKDFTLDFFFHGSFGGELLNAPYHLSYFARDARSNLLPILKDRWTPTNSNSDIPRAGSTFGNYQPRSTVSYQDGSFIRLKNITLTYDLDIPGIKSSSVYITANNLLLLTDWEFGDPEVSDSGDGLNSGIATQVYPYNTTVALGFNLTL